jgi:hypothetical protein
MAYRYNVNERIFGGSMEGRLNPEFGGDRINTKLGPNRPTPLVRETSAKGCVYENGNDQRRRLIGLPPRFDRKG